MEEELSRQFGQLATDERLPHLEIPPDDGNGNDFNESSNESCNLIVNYLPHDIDDTGLRVSPFSLPLIVFLCFMNRNYFLNMVKLS